MTDLVKNINEAEKIGISILQNELETIRQEKYVILYALGMNGLIMVNAN